MGFVVIWSAPAKKQLSKLEKKTSNRIILKVTAVCSFDSLLIEKIKGKNFFKIRAGDYRIFVDKQILTKRIIVHSIWHRKNAYKKL